ncbi:hypothetical protein D3C72_952090 [compost metagenome]
MVGDTDQVELRAHFQRSGVVAVTALVGLRCSSDVAVGHEVGSVTGSNGRDEHGAFLVQDRRIAVGVDHVDFLGVHFGTGGLVVYVFHQCHVRHDLNSAAFLSIDQGGAVDRFSERILARRAQVVGRGNDTEVTAGLLVVVFQGNAFAESRNGTGSADHLATGNDDVLVAGADRTGRSQQSFLVRGFVRCAEQAHGSSDGHVVANASGVGATVGVESFEAQGSQGAAQFFVNVGHLVRNVGSAKVFLRNALGHFRLNAQSRTSGVQVGLKVFNESFDVELRANFSTLGEQLLDVFHGTVPYRGVFCLLLKQGYLNTH